jgi:hypothetical protein
MALTEFGLLIQNSRYSLELRNLVNGEVRRVWPQITGIHSVAVHQHFAAVADSHGGLWLVDLSD